MTVLVTGGTGFVAGWCIAQLLEQGHDVRTTVRTPAAEARIRAAAGLAADDPRLSVAVADLTSDDGWDAAVQGCEHVLHVASPMGGGTNPKNPDDLIVPARDGTLRVLRAAVRGGAGRVVMTSSCAAATPGPDAGDGTYDETVWSDPANPKLDTYRISKAVAERAAWDFMTEHGGSTEFATVLPGAVFGPIRSRDGLGSVQVIGRMLSGMPGVPRIGLNVVDVRDLADLHLRAMTDAAAVGERFIGVGGFMWMSEVAAELRAQLGDAARRVPTRTLPDLGVRLFARVRPELGGLVPMLGRRYSHSNAKARTRLGWDPRPPATTVVDCARSLIDAGVV